jgi:hypothetical protein
MNWISRTPEIEDVYPCTILNESGDERDGRGPTIRAACEDATAKIPRRKR